MAKPEDIQFYNELPSYGHFSSLLCFLNPGEAGESIVWWQQNRATPSADTRGCQRKLSTVNQLFLGLCKLKLNFFYKHLSHFFKISCATVYRIMNSWLNSMYIQLSQLPLWQPRHLIGVTMTAAFSERYLCTRVIIGATELKCEVPSSFVLLSGSYSAYKSSNPFKGLIGISPSGLVTFVAVLFLGCISDKELIVKSAFLQISIEGDDSVMADKGFRITGLLAEKNVSLNIPPFLRQGQFSPE